MKLLYSTLTNKFYTIDEEKKLEKEEEAIREQYRKRQKAALAAKKLKNKDSAAANKVKVVVRENGKEITSEEEKMQKLEKMIEEIKRFEERFNRLFGPLGW